MNPRLLAGFLIAFAWLALGLVPAAFFAARARKPLTAALEAAIGLGAAAILVNSAIDLWRTAP